MRIGWPSCTLLSVMCPSMGPGPCVAHPIVVAHSHILGWYMCTSVYHRVGYVHLGYTMVGVLPVHHGGCATCAPWWVGTPCSPMVGSVYQGPWWVVYTLPYHPVYHGGHTTRWYIASLYIPGYTSSLPVHPLLVHHHPLTLRCPVMEPWAQHWRNPWVGGLLPS